MSRHLAAAALVGACALASGAAAQDIYPYGTFELRGGVMAHSVDEAPPPGSILPVGNFTRIQDANVELLFTPPGGDFWRLVGSPRPTIGATVNFAGLESMVYGALTWRLPVFETGVFLEGALGAALNNGKASGAVYPARDVGCPFGFYEAFSLGYQMTERAGVMATFQHTSHAGLCGAAANRGLTNLGVRVGWTF